MSPLASSSLNTLPVLFPHAAEPPRAGHTSAVIELSAPAERPGVLASLTRDGNLRVWDVCRETCLASHATDAASLVPPPPPPPRSTVLCTVLLGVLSSAHPPDASHVLSGHSWAHPLLQGLDGSPAIIDATHLRVVRVLPAASQAFPITEGAQQSLTPCNA